MGQHVRHADKAAPRGRWLSLATRIPLLPAVVGTGAVGVVAVALSTTQISLDTTRDSPSGCQGHGCQAVDPDRGDLSVSRGRANTVAVAFSTTPRARGFRGTATITNESKRKIKSWTLKFHIPDAKVRKVRDAELVQAGSAVVLRSSSGAETFRPGASVTVWFRGTGEPGMPGECFFNKRPCRIS